MNSAEAMALKLHDGEQLLIPFGNRAHLVWTRANGQTAALGLVRQGQKTLNLSAEGSERSVRMLDEAKAQRLLTKLREKPKFREFEQKLQQQGKRLAESKLRVLLDETSNLAVIGLANEGSEGIAHQLRIRLKANKDDELDDSAEPQIQATACGQAKGEAVALGAALEPQALNRYPILEEGWGSYTTVENSSSEICASQWGYNYSCYSTTPVLSLASTSLQMAAFAGQNAQANVTIWNSGGGRLTGTATVGAPFSIVSGGSFSLAPGQPQQVTVRFAPSAAGSFSGNLQLTSNGGSVTVALRGGTVSVSPAQLSYTAFVGSPQEQKLTLKNDGAVAATVNLGQLSTPFGFKNSNSPYFSSSVVLEGGQTREVFMQFAPTASGSFSGSAALGLSGACVRRSEVWELGNQCLEQSVAQGSANVALAGTAHKVSVTPAELDFGIVFVGSTRERKLTVKNEGTTTVVLTVGRLGPIFKASGSTVTLAPNQSHQVSVEFSPTTSGTLTESLRLSIESNNITIPVIGAAYTREEFEEAVYKACQTRQAHEQANYAALEPKKSNLLFYRDPSPSNYHIENMNALFYGLPCLTPEQLRHVMELIERDQWDVPDPVLDPVLEQLFNWNKQNVSQAVQFLLEKFREHANMSPDNQTAFILGWIQRMITPGNQYYNPDFAAFHNWLNASSAAPGFFQRLIAQGFLAALGSIPGIGHIITIWQAVIGALEPGSTGQISAAQAFITLLVATMHAYSAQGAIQTVQALLLQWGSTPLMGALQTLVLTGSLVAAGENYQIAGLTLAFYAGFLERMRTAPTLRYNFDHYLDALSRGPNLSRADAAEHYANLMGGFMTLVNLVEKGWDVKSIPAAHLTSGRDYCRPILCTNIIELVHVIARKNVVGIGSVTAFVHVQARLGPNEVGSIVSNINRILQDIDALNRSPHTTPWHGSYPVVVQVSFNAHTSDVTAVMNRLGTPSVPVVSVYVDQNGVWQAKAACPASGCPGGLSPEEFAKKIAEEMGYKVGKKYDPLTDLPPLFRWAMVA